MKTKRNAAASSQKYRGKQSYGVGGAVMTLGKNLLQGKKLGDGALKGVLRAGITPGSGIGAGIGLAGALAGKSKNPTMQKIGKGLGIAGSVAGMFTGGGAGGAGALGGLAGKFAGSGAGQAASKFAGNFAGLDKTLGGIGAASGGNPLVALAQNLLQKGEHGMKVVRGDNSDPKKPSFPQIDIEKKNIQTNANPDVGGGDFENEYQFMLDGAPATSQEAAAALKLSQEGVHNPQSFNDFVHSYLNQYNSERGGGGGGVRGRHSYKPQLQSKNTRKESAGSEGLIEALRQYGERT